MNNEEIQFSEKVKEFGLIPKTFIKLIKIKVKDTANNLLLELDNGHILEELEFGKPLYFNEGFNRCITSPLRGIYKKYNYVYIESDDSIYMVEFLHEEKPKKFFYEN